MTQELYRVRVNVVEIHSTAIAVVGELHEHVTASCNCGRGEEGLFEKAKHNSLVVHDEVKLDVMRGGELLLHERQNLLLPSLRNQKVLDEHWDLLVVDERLHDKFVRLVHDADLGLHVELLEVLVLLRPRRRPDFVDCHQPELLHHPLRLWLQEHGGLALCHGYTRLGSPFLLVHNLNSNANRRFSGNTFCSIPAKREKQNCSSCPTYLG